MEINKSDLGQRVKRIRVNQKMTMEKFADEINVKTEGVSTPGKSNVSRWERGENIPNDITLKAIAELGGISVDELLYGSFDELIQFTLNETLEEFLTSPRNEYDYYENPDRFNQALKEVADRKLKAYTSGNIFLHPYSTESRINLKNDFIKKMEEVKEQGEITPDNARIYIKRVLKDAEDKILVYKDKEEVQQLITSGEIDKDLFNKTLTVLNELQKELETSEEVSRAEFVENIVRNLNKDK